jgi:DNA-binding winged helix-turn-helix (wHTH) protein
LRRKLDGSGTTRLLKTVRNGGYQFAVKVELRDFPS